MLSDKSKDTVKQYLRNEFGIEAGDILRVYEDEWECEMCDDTCGSFEFGICIEFTDLNSVKQELREHVAGFLQEYVTENNG